METGAIRDIDAASCLWQIIVLTSILGEVFFWSVFISLNTCEVGSNEISRYLSLYLSRTFKFSSAPMMCSESPKTCRK